MSKNVVLITVVVLVVAVGGWYLTRPKAVVTPLDTALPIESPASESASPQATDSAVMTEIKVSASEFAFSPETLSVKKGEKVKITFQNNGKYPHDLKIDELGVTTKVTSAGQTDTVEFTASKSGNFTMYCSVGNHREQGMEGTVTVN